jgi:hypothetical protein
MPNGAFQPGASDDPTTSPEERCTLASHFIARERRCNRNRHRYRLPRRPPASTRQMALAAQARRWYVSGAFRGAMSALRSTRQDAQINDLSTLSIFTKQKTYLATLPNPKIFLTLQSSSPARK